MTEREWPKGVVRGVLAKPGPHDECRVVPADLALKQHKAMQGLLDRAAVSSHGLCNAADDPCPECAKRWEAARAASLAYKREVGND